MSHNWPFDTMMTRKLPAQRIPFDHPSVLLGEQFAREVLHNNFVIEAREFIAHAIFAAKRNLPTNNFSGGHGVTMGRNNLNRIRLQEGFA